MNDGLFDDYGEVILYAALSVLVLGFMGVIMGAFTAF